MTSKSNPGPVGSNKPANADQAANDTRPMAEMLQAEAQAPRSMPAVVEAIPALELHHRFGTLMPVLVMFVASPLFAALLLLTTDAPFGLDGWAFGMGFNAALVTGLITPWVRSRLVIMLRLIMSIAMMQFLVGWYFTFGTEMFQSLPAATAHGSLYQVFFVSTLKANTWISIVCLPAMTWAASAGNLWRQHRDLQDHIEADVRR